MPLGRIGRNGFASKRRGLRFPALLLLCERNSTLFIDNQNKMQRRLAAAGTAVCGGTRAVVPRAAKQMLHYSPEAINILMLQYSPELQQESYGIFCVLRSLNHWMT